MTTPVYLYMYNNTTAASGLQCWSVLKCLKTYNNFVRFSFFWYNRHNNENWGRNSKFQSLMELKVPLKCIAFHKCCLLSKVSAGSLISLVCISSTVSFLSMLYADLALQYHPYSSNPHDPPASLPSVINYLRNSSSCTNFTIKQWAVSQNHIITHALELWTSQFIASH